MKRHYETAEYPAPPFQPFQLPFHYETAGTARIC